MPKVPPLFPRLNSFFRKGRPCNMPLPNANFLKDLTDFVAQNDAFSTEKWTLHKAHDGFWAKQSVMLKWKGESINRQSNIIYNPTYGVPVLWFNFYHRDGRPLQLSSILELSRMNNNQLGADLEKNITQNEHPYLGVMFYNIHPCNTTKIMEELKGDGNYIVRWLSVYGTPIGIRLPDQLLGELLMTSLRISKEPTDEDINSTKKRLMDNGSQESIDSGAETIPEITITESSYIEERED